MSRTLVLMVRCSSWASLLIRPPPGAAAWLTRRRHLAERRQPLPPIQSASVFFSPDPFFTIVSIDNDTQIRLAAAAPEPGTWFLLATGLAGLLGFCWRRRRWYVLL